MLAAFQRRENRADNIVAMDHVYVAGAVAADNCLAGEALPKEMAAFRTVDACDAEDYRWQATQEMFGLHENLAGLSDRLGRRVFVDDWTISVGVNTGAAGVDGFLDF